MKEDKFKRNIFPIVESIDANWEKVNMYFLNHESTPLSAAIEDDFDEEGK